MYPDREGCTLRLSQIQVSFKDPRQNLERRGGGGKKGLDWNNWEEELRKRYLTGTIGRKKVPAPTFHHKDSIGFHRNR